MARMAGMAGMAERQKEWQIDKMAEVVTYVLFMVRGTWRNGGWNSRMVKWRMEWQNGGNGGWNGRMADGMAEWRNC